jgi:hypothetical protein
MSGSFLEIHKIAPTLKKMRASLKQKLDFATFREKWNASKI